MGSVVALLFVICASAFAQSEDPPSRVGRLSEASGPVFIAPDDPGTDWEPASLNYPVTIGDNMWSGQDGRAEVDFGAGHVRLSSETNIHFAQLDDTQFSAYLASGRAILRLRALEQGDYAKFDTANVQVDILRPGTYRVEADADGLNSVVVVRDGEAVLRTADSTLTVYSGQTATISSSGSGTSIVVRDGSGTDGFDAWSNDRDRRYEGGSLSSQYVSSYVPGVRDLDYYGTWDSVPTYGPVWYPTSVSLDWVPYRDGSWTFVRPWGWTWVDHAPWGFAPFHYGRWVRIGHRWAWCPGEYVRRPIYSPALVAWYGGPSGTNWSVSFGGPTFGWVPLAWGEPYYPHHRHSASYWRVINRPYAVNVQRVPLKPLPVGHANARIPGALTAVSGDVFTGRGSVATNYRPVPVSVLSSTAPTTAPIAARPMIKPLPVDSRPRGAPAPAGAFIGRTSVERSELNSGAGRVFTGRPSIGPGTGAVSDAPRPGYTPSVGGGRTVITEPMPGLRPVPGSPASGRPGISEPHPQTIRPITREPASPAAGSPMQVPGQVYTPGLAPAPPPQRFTPAPRSLSPEPAPLQQRPMIREPAVQRAPTPPQAQGFAPSLPSASVAQQPIPQPYPNVPQQRAPAPQYVPGPAPQPAPVVREPMPAAPQVQRPGIPNQGVGRPEQPMPNPSSGTLPR
jgi:hypothetical protein